MNNPLKELDEFDKTGQAMPEFICVKLEGIDAIAWRGSMKMIKPELKSKFASLIIKMGLTQFGEGVINGIDKMGI